MELTDNIIPLPTTGQPASHPRPQTAAQHNMPLVGSTTFTADELRSKLLELFEQSKPQLQIYHDYAERCVALSLEYHFARIAENFPGVTVEELTLAATFDARETPKSLDVKLAQLADAKVVIKRVIFDRVKSTYLLFI